MIAEQLDIQFDIKRLQNYFETYVKHLEPTRQGEMFGGWSILSTSGDYRDGFQMRDRYYSYDQNQSEYVFDNEKAHRETGYTPPRMHVNLTQVGTEYVAEVIETIRKLGLKPHRARWTWIPPNGTTIWHRDAEEFTYGVRLHIPVFTNSECIFETEEGTYHMPADGHCYLVDVSCLHRAYNHGKEDRIHIIMDVIDDEGFSEYHSTYRVHRSNNLINIRQIKRLFKKLFLK